jgi:hypothetical protein
VIEQQVHLERLSAHSNPVLVIDKDEVLAHLQNEVFHVGDNLLP